MSIREPVLRFLGHLLWPSSCSICGAMGVPACVECLLPLLSPPMPASLGDFPLETGGIHEGILRDFVLELKYGGDRTLGVAMGRALGRIFPKPSAEVLVPVPLHRDSVRGFNQSKAIAEGLCLEWGIPVSDCLEWREERIAQTARKESERRNMPLDAMAVRRKGLGGKWAVLVDDVATTGTTLIRAGAAVENGGGRTVCAYTWTAVPKGGKG